MNNKRYSILIVLVFEQLTIIYMIRIVKRINRHNPLQNKVDQLERYGDVLEMENNFPERVHLKSKPAGIFWGNTDVSIDFEAPQEGEIV